MGALGARWVEYIIYIALLRLCFCFCRGVEEQREVEVAMGCTRVLSNRSIMILDKYVPELQERTCRESNSNV
jgi:hypothetical protein